jgi:hypothetical protein
MPVNVRITAVTAAAAIAMLAAQAAGASTVAPKDTAPAASALSGRPAPGALRRLALPGIVLHQDAYEAQGEAAGSAPTGPDSILWD